MRDTDFAIVTAAPSTHSTALRAGFAQDRFRRGKLAAVETGVFSGRNLSKRPLSRRFIQPLRQGTGFTVRGIDWSILVDSSIPYMLKY